MRRPPRYPLVRDLSGGVLPLKGRKARFGGMGVNEGGRLRWLEEENRRLNGCRHERQRTRNHVLQGPAQKNTGTCGAAGGPRTASRSSGDSTSGAPPTDRSPLVVCYRQFDNDGLELRHGLCALVGGKQGGGMTGPQGAAVAPTVSSGSCAFLSSATGSS